MKSISRKTHESHWGTSASKTRPKASAGQRTPNAYMTASDVKPTIVGATGGQTVGNDCTNRA